MNRRTTWGIVLMLACLAMLAASAFSVQGCAPCFGGGWCTAPEGPQGAQGPQGPPGPKGPPGETPSPYVAPTPQPVPAEPLMPAEPPITPTPEPEPTEAPEPLPPQVTPIPQPVPVELAPPADEPDVINCRLQMARGFPDADRSLGVPCGCADETIMYIAPAFSDPTNLEVCRVL